MNPLLRIQIHTNTVANGKTIGVVYVRIMQNSICTLSGRRMQSKLECMQLLFEVSVGAANQLILSIADLCRYFAVA